jgi:hypothetical protein
MMRRDANVTKTAISKRTCEVDKTLLQRLAVRLAHTRVSDECFLKKMHTKIMK